MSLLLRKKPRLQFRAIEMMAGPTIVIQHRGKINSTSGTIICTLHFFGGFLAVKLRSSRMDCAKTLRVSAILVPKRSVWIRIAPGT